jgi:hypothetical protein
MTVAKATVSQFRPGKSSEYPAMCWNIGEKTMTGTVKTRQTQKRRRKSEIMAEWSCAACFPPVWAWELWPLCGLVEGDGW